MSNGIVKDLTILRTISFLLVVFPATIYFLERRLTRRVKAYRSGIEAAFPAIVEMLTLSLSAGESPLSAIREFHRAEQVSWLANCDGL